MRKYKDVGEYCLVDDENYCECGRDGYALLRCTKPLSDERRHEIMENMRQEQAKKL
jgi:predicted Fe-S protein YdhL (DUF1289 family)